MTDKPIDNSKVETTTLEKPAKKKPGKRPGSPRTGGRLPGTPNIKSWVMRDQLDHHKFNPAEELIKIIQTTTDTDQKWIRLIQLCKYVYPELKEIEPSALQNQNHRPSSPAPQLPTDTLISLVKSN
jgi:hypothetical protein